MNYFRALQLMWLLCNMVQWFTARFCLLFCVARLKARGTEHCLTANVALMGSILRLRTPMDTCSSLVLAPAASTIR